MQAVAGLNNALPTRMVAQCGEGFEGLLFVLAASLIFRYPRIAVGGGLAASYFSLPLFVYLVFPRPFRQVFPGNWSVPEIPQSNSFGTDGGVQELC